MGFFYVVFSFCVSATGYENHCQQEKLIDTQYLGLVSCYTGAKSVEKRTTEQILQEAQKNNVKDPKIEVKTRCINSAETEAFLKQWGPSALVITGKKYE
ncbi:MULTISPECIES: hypothetical protein [unclassified Pseudomonas]|jgi:hypothetical protein|uniref:hypothetical protein n=1 Tax=unclassified Pseudomonas TaxID=196821 RepID=UPI000871A402|nr:MULTISPECIES: hypothetical protein [unclassified Pseudomonas]SCW76110.1 hypothetical protein SAMN03159424_02993 [Pseudomonas sp. NFACC05-1]SEI69153.1 hypothetical protein SAMN03159298_01072 [Pseudomonas sp. NFACC07-1]